MPIKLFITPQEIASTTILGGNVDIDKYSFEIENAMITVIEPLLGTLLYDKIVTDWTADALAGDYLILFEEYVQPITKNEATAEYIEISSYILANGGLFKHAPDNAEVVDKDEAQFLGGKYHNLAQMYILRFNKWICKNTITEYKTWQDDVNASKTMTVRSGWHFGSKRSTISCDCNFDCDCV
jgi:hypothetical protein